MIKWFEIMKTVVKESDRMIKFERGSGHGFSSTWDGYEKKLPDENAHVIFYEMFYEKYSVSIDFDILQSQEENSKETLSSKLTKSFSFAIF